MSTSVEHAVVTAPIVVVEDDDSSRELIRRYLVNLRLSNPVVGLVDGVQAIERLAEPDVTPALVLLDLGLPGRDGLEVLAWIRAQAHLRDVPVVLLTGSSELDDIDRAYALGISSYLVKPVGFTALEDVLRRLDADWSLLAPSARD